MGDKSKSEIAELLRFRCAISAMDPMDRGLLLNAATVLDAAMDIDRRLAELQEAARWYRECEECSVWQYGLFWDDDDDTVEDIDEITEIERCARVAVDALVGEE
jgi:hypothetical protein